MSDITEVKVWDAAVRLFHWGLVAAFATAYVSGDELLAVHTSAGYGVLALLAFRVVWGFVGTGHARFGDFVTSPRAGWAYLRELLHGRAVRYLGHNPAGGVMILLLLASLLALTVSGLALYGAEEHAGPLAAWMAGFTGAGALEDAHELFANLVLVLAIVHVAGVVVESVLHRENLIRSMFTGHKRA